MPADQSQNGTRSAMGVLLKTLAMVVAFGWILALMAVAAALP
jgi:hypothetical protein